MGEEAAKPKKERGGPGRNYRGHQRAKATSSKAFKGPTPCIEQYVFKQGGANDAVDFPETKKQLAKWAGLHFKVGNVMAQAAIDRLLEEPNIVEPTDPAPAASPPTMADIKAQKKWELEYETYYKEKRVWDEVRPRAFNLIMSHVHPDLEQKIEESKKWEAISADQDVIELLKLIRAFVHKHDEVKQGTMSLVEYDLDLKLNFQKDNVTLSEFYKAFKARCDIIDTFGGRCGYHPVLYKDHREEMAKRIGVDVSLLTKEQNQAAMKASCEEYKAALFIRISNDSSYSGLKKKLDNMWLFNQAAYPKTLDEAYRYLSNYKPEVTSKPKQQDKKLGHDGVSFLQRDQKDLGPCNGCGEMGHLIRNCKKLTNEEKKAVLQAMQDGTYQQGQAHTNVSDADAEQDLKELMDGVANINVNLEDASIVSAEDMGDEMDMLDGFGFINPTTTGQKRLDCGRNKLFLDSCATQHTMFAKEYLTRFHATKLFLRQNCNAGSKVTNKCGYWGGLRFYYNDEGIANLLSMPALEKAGWKVHIQTGAPVQAMSPAGTVLTFKRDVGLTGGMPYLDMDDLPNHVSKIIPRESVVCVETVRENMRGLTLQECARAKGARDALAMMAHPPEDRIRHLVSSNNVLNVPFTSTDFSNGRVVFGKDRGSLRGKDVRQRPSRVRPELITIPQQLYEKLRDVVLTADVMFLNGLPFFVTLSRNIKLITVEFLPSRMAEQYHLHLQKVCRLYRRGGFLVRTALMDMAFKPLEDISEEVLVNTTAAREHVTDIERCIRFLKDRCRSVLAEVPYKHCMPDQFLLYLLRFVVMWINAFVSGSGASDEFSPREIVTGMRLDYAKHCKARWGSYCEASEDADITNTLADRTLPCIVLGPTGNVQGSVFCFNLMTKQVVTRRTITPLPMPDRVIRRVIKLGENSKQKRISSRIQFLNRFQQKFAWGDGTEDDDDATAIIEPHETDVLPAEIPSVELVADTIVSDELITSDHVPTDGELAEAALANANLTPPLSPEIAGVGLTAESDDNVEPPTVTDDEGDDDDNGSEAESDEDSEVEYVQQGDEIDLTREEDFEDSDAGQEDEAPQDDFEADEAHGDPDEAQGALSDEDEVDGRARNNLGSHLASLAQDEGDLGMANEEDSTGAVVRRSRRKKKKSSKTVIDFKNKAYQLQDGVLHINPCVLKQTKEDAKITSEILPGKKDMGTEQKDTSRLMMKSPRIAGVSRRALNKVSLDALGMPAPTLKEGEAVVEDHVVMHILGVVLAEQYSINKGIRLFGERAKESITKELRQLHDYVTYRPVHAHELTAEEKRQALASLIFITEKRCGRIKTRACVNGSTQRDYIPRENTASPTVMNDSVLIQSAIDAHEGRVVVTCDIPGAFLHADLDEEVVMLLRGQLADLMVQVDPSLYGPYLRKSKKGESILYVCMLKAMYGLLRSALLFYLKLVKDLTAYGFELNPYDPCVANKIVKGKQLSLTVVWHVDDLKISHESHEAVNDLIEYLKGKYGDNLVVHTGHVHDYLGVDHDYSEKGVVKLSMMKHLDKIFNDFPDELG